MSQLGPLKIAGILTPCSRVVRVQNQLIGATVKLTVKPKVGPSFTAGGTAFWPDQEFAIPALNKQDTVTAVQSQAGFSDSTPTSATVGDHPTAADLSSGKFALPLYLCAKCVYLYNMIPGATVEVESNGQPLGKEVVRSDGEAVVSLSRELTNGDNLKAFQSCGGPPGSAIVGGLPLAPPNPLPPPKVETAVECDQIITVSGIINGAQVTVTRGGQKLAPICSPTGRLFILPIKPLKKPTDDPITAVQAFPHDLCRLHSPAGSTPLLSKDQIKPPSVDVLCEGMTSFNVFNLRLGAMVEVTANGKTLVYGAGTAAISVPVSPLTVPQTVTARQNTCGDPGSWSALAKVVVGAAKPVSPGLTSPANNATKISTTPTLIFADLGTFCNRANSFDVQIATNAAFTSQVQTTNVGSGTNFWIPPKKLKFSTLYFWRVRSNHVGQVSSAWTTFKFTTVADGQPPQPSGTPPPPQSFCFIEDCCPYMRRVIVVTATSQADAEAQARAKAASNCTITPTDCNTKVPPCGQP